MEKLLPGNDGKIRAAIVKVPRINGKSQLLKGVAQHLIPNEVQAESTDKQEPGHSSIHCKDHNQYSIVIHLQGDHTGMKQYAEKSFEKNFWDFDFEIIWQLKCVKSGEC